MINYYNLPGFFTILFGCLVLIYSYNFFSETKLVITSREIIIILVISALIMINNYYNDQNLKVPVTIFLLTFFFYLIYKKPFFENLCLSIFISILSLVVEFSISIVLMCFVKNIRNLNHSLLIKNSFSLLYFWSYYFIYRIFFFKKIYKKMLDIFKRQKEKIILIYCFIFMIGFLYAFYALNYANLQIYFFSFLIICLFGIIIFFYLKELHNNQLLNIKNKFLMDKQIMFNNTIDDFRTLKHNLLNDFIFISSLCDDNTQKVIKEKILKYDIDICNYNDLRNIPEGLQGILYFKSSFARKKSIDFYIDCDKNFKYQNLEKRLYIDLCEIVGVILDNAIEASSQALSKAIYINIKDFPNKIIIKVLNTYNNDIDLDNIGNKNYSTKNRNSGLGLYYIKKLNKNIKIKNSFIFDLFKIKIIIKK